MNLSGNKMNISYLDQSIYAESPRFDLIEPNGASVIARINSLDKDYPIITTNKYGKGTAIYIGIPARGSLLDSLIEDLLNKGIIDKSIETPKDVMARYIDTKHLLYINLSKEDKIIALKGKAKSILYGTSYDGQFTLKAFEPEFIEVQ